MSTSSNYDMMGAIAGMGLVVMIISLAVAVFAIICMWKIYEKADEPGWAAIVPFYNTYVLFKITWGNGWFFLLCMIPFANFVVLIITYWKLAKVFGGGVVEFLLLLFLPVVAFPIMAFGGAEYEGIE